MKTDKNVFERRGEELQKYARVDENIFPETLTEAPKKKALPPYNCRTNWMERFLDVIQKVSTSRIDAKFVASNIVGSKNEGKVLSALKFLGIIDSAGNGQENLRKLRTVGEEFDKNLASIVSDAYRDLMDTLPVSTAKPENLINYFVREYGYNATQAGEASRFFVWLAQKAKIQVSSDLVEVSPPKGGTAPKKSSTMDRKLRLPVKKGSLRGTRGPAQLHLNVTINLDKDTPPEIWKKVWALLGVETE